MTRVPQRMSAITSRFSGAPGRAGAVAVGLLLLGAFALAMANAQEPVGEPETPPAAGAPQAPESPTQSAPAAETPAKTPPLPIELAPYLVRMQIWFENGPQFADDFRRMLLEEV